MDTEVLVETKIEDGDKLLRQLTHDQFGVEVAFWAQRTEQSSWSLYVASTSIVAERLNDAYRIIFAALEKIVGCSILVSEIRILTRTDPITRDAMALRDRYPSRGPKRYRGVRLGTLSTEEICIYPRVLPLRVREVPSGPWQVQISELDDVWLTCDSESDARTIAVARVLEHDALERRNGGEKLAIELEKTAEVMEKYRMGFGSRRLRGLAEDIQKTKAKSGMTVS